MNELENSSLIPIILSGGSGTRLWPVSRKSFPKQFWALDGCNKYSLLQNTIKRLEKTKNVANPIIVCSEEHRFIVAEQCRNINVIPKAIILEPEGKNTAPAISAAILAALNESEKANLIVLSSDHIIKNEEQFSKAVELGKEFIKDGKIITFGVIPDSPETGYGYIMTSNHIDINDLKGREVKQFIEKPDFITAQNFVNDGRYFWNSGIFMFEASLMLNELEKYSPKNTALIKSSYEKSEIDLDFLRLDKETFKNCEDISIDNAVMEKTKLSVVIPLDKGWSDIGNWHSLWKSSKRDEKNNFVLGKAYLERSENNYIRSDKRLVVTLGINNSVIVETDDVVLVADMRSSQDIKTLVNRLREKGFCESDIHNLVYRPWGNYQSMAEGHRWQVKLIKVKPGASLSLQMHHHRAEHWIVVKGTAKVEVDGKIKLLSENQSIHIPLGNTHRLTNPGKLTLELIEVQSGPYLEEDDIVRFNDKYGRK